MRNFIYILTIIFSLNSCSEYQAVLKGDDVATKFKFATELFESGKYTKANRIFVQIVPKYRGKPQAEKLMFMYCMTFYETRDYFTSNYQMERFVEAYPKSEKAEEIGFLAAKSYYMLSPAYTKDQSETLIAIDKPNPKIGPIRGEISIAPITTGIEFAFKPTDATNIEHIKIQAVGPLIEISFLIE